MSSSKKLVLLVTLFACIFSSTLVTFSHEIASGKSFRWKNTYIKNNKRVVDVRYNGDYLNTNWKNQLYNGAVSWNNNSDSRAYFYSETYSVSKCKLASVTEWASWLPSTAIAYTNLKDTTGVWFLNFDDGSYNGGIGNVIVEAHIYYNPGFDSDSTWSSTEKRKTLAHEFGHVMGLGHPESTISSIMRKGTEKASYPTQHDKTDLANFYPN